MGRGCRQFPYLHGLGCKASRFTLRSSPFRVKAFGGAGKGLNLSG